MRASFQVLRGTYLPILPCVRLQQKVSPCCHLLPLWQFYYGVVSQKCGRRAMAAFSRQATITTLLSSNCCRAETFPTYGHYRYEKYGGDLYAVPWHHIGNICDSQYHFREIGRAHV